MYHDYKNIQTEEFMNSWFSKKWTDHESFNIYVANPFCLKKCNYCIYNPIVRKIDSKDYKKYYNEYLPKQIEKFKPILEMKTPDTIYFGGGTASFMTAETMKAIFDAIPNFKDIKLKNFECHPILMTDKKIKTLIDYNFTYVSYGIQSMSREIINEQNRFFYDIPKIKKQLEVFKKNDIITNCDLLAYMETGRNSDLDTLKTDLAELNKKIMPDVITIYPMYQRLKSNIHSYSNANHNYKKIYGLRKTLKEFVEKSNYNSNDSQLSLEKGKIISAGMVNYFLLNISEKKFISVRKYNSSGYPQVPSNQNVLALGGLYDHSPYSYLGKKKYWKMINDNWELRIKEKIS